MAMPARLTRRWTTGDVRALMDESRAWPRFELIGGELLVTPAPAGPHQVAVTELVRLVGEYCDAERVGVALVSPSDLELIPGTITQPDVFVLPYSVLPEGDEPFGWPMVSALRLVIEVISPSSVHTDRVVKRDHFLSADVEEYWVVDLEARMVERWLKERETPIAVRERLAWHPVPAAAPLTIDLPAFFARIAGRLRRPR